MSDDTMALERDSLAAAETSIGEALRRSRTRLVLAGLVGAAIVGADLLMASTAPNAIFSLALVAGAFVFYGLLTGWHWRSLGLALKPRQRVTYWVKVTMVLAAVHIVVAAVVFSVAGLYVNNDLVNLLLRGPPSRVWYWALYLLVIMPVLEEGIYRFALCVPAVAILGKWGAIVLSGVVFAALHFLYGVAAPYNLIAGFLLGWAYVKSRSIIVPICLHSLGNICVGIFHLAYCYYHWGRVML